MKGRFPCIVPLSWHAREGQESDRDSFHGSLCAQQPLIISITKFLLMEEVHIVLQKRFNELLKKHLLHSYGTGADSADHGRSGVDGMSVQTFYGTGADSADRGHSGVDGISLPTLPVTGADSPVLAYFGDDGISSKGCFC